MASKFNLEIVVVSFFHPNEALSSLTIISPEPFSCNYFSGKAMTSLYL